MEGHSFQDLGGIVIKGPLHITTCSLSVSLHLLRVSFFKFQALEHVHACHCTLFSAPCRNVAEGHVHKCLIMFSTFPSSPLSYCCCCFTWAFLPFSLGSKFQEEYQGTLRKRAAFTFGFPFRCTAAHWTVQFSFPQNSPAS